MANFIFPKPDIQKPSYSTRDLSVVKKTTFAPGVLIPILMKDILPGDKITINLKSLIESFPMIAPSLDAWKANFDFYFEPWSNLYGFMDNNVREDTEDLINKNRHIFSFGVDGIAGYPNVTSAVKPGSFMDYYGLPCGYFGDSMSDDQFVPGRFPAEKLLAYWDILRNYYVNNQERRFALVDSSPVSSTGDPEGLQMFPLSVLDRIFKYIRMQDDGVDISDYQSWLLPHLDSSEHRDVGNFFNTYFAGFDVDMQGLATRTYRMDLNRGVMNADVGNLKSRVQVTDNQFSIDTLRFANKMQKLIDRFDVSGGRFSDWMRAQWSVKVRGNLDVPDYLGSVSEFFGNTDIVATANGAVTTSTGVSPKQKVVVLGQQAGFAVGRVNRDNNPITFTSDQYGTLVCIFSLVPLVDYSQGIERENLKTKFADVYSPAMAQLGYQDVDIKELSALPILDDLDGTDPSWAPGYVNPQSGEYEGYSVGKQVAWAEYLASLGRNHGYFAYGEALDYWVNQRLYQSEVERISINPESEQGVYLRYGGKSFTTYISPGQYNYLFAETSRLAQNFRIRCRFDIVAKRPIGSRLMPHL